MLNSVPSYIILPSVLCVTCLSRIFSLLNHEPNSTLHLPSCPLSPPQGDRCLVLRGAVKSFWGRGWEGDRGERKVGDLRLTVPGTLQVSKRLPGVYQETCTPASLLARSPGQGDRLFNVSWG